MPNPPLAVWIPILMNVVALLQCVLAATSFAEATVVKKNAKVAKKWKKLATTTPNNLSRKAVAFGIILTVRNGNASDLIASRREPPQ